MECFSKQFCIISKVTDSKAFEQKHNASGGVCKDGGGFVGAKMPFERLK